MSVYYDYDGEPIGQDEWARLFERSERCLKQEWVLGPDGERFFVSTVWIGIDHNLASRTSALQVDGVDTRPWIYETMGFRNQPHWTSVVAQTGAPCEQVRDATRDEALHTHRRVVRILADGERTLDEAVDALLW